MMQRLFTALAIILVVGLAPMNAMALPEPMQDTPAARAHRTAMQMIAQDLVHVLREAVQVSDPRSPMMVSLRTFGIKPSYHEVNALSAQAPMHYVNFWSHVFGSPVSIANGQPEFGLSRPLLVNRILSSGILGLIAYCIARNYIHDEPAAPYMQALISVLSSLAGFWLVPQLEATAAKRTTLAAVNQFKLNLFNEVRKLGVEVPIGEEELWLSLLQGGGEQDRLHQAALLTVPATGVLNEALRFERAILQAADNLQTNARQAVLIDLAAILARPLKAFRRRMSYRATSAAHKSRAKAALVHAIFMARRSFLTFASEMEKHGETIDVNSVLSLQGIAEYFPDAHPFEAVFPPVIDKITGRGDDETRRWVTQAGDNLITSNFLDAFTSQGVGKVHIESVKIMYNPTPVVESDGQRPGLLSFTVQTVLRDGQGNLFSGEGVGEFKAGNAWINLSPAAVIQEETWAEGVVQAMELAIRDAMGKMERAAAESQVRATRASNGPRVSAVAQARVPLVNDSAVRCDDNLSGNASVERVRVDVSEATVPADDFENFETGGSGDSALVHSNGQLFWTK